MPPPTPLLTERELVSLVGGGLAADEVGPLEGLPLVAVAIDGSAQCRRLLPMVRHLPCVTVGVAAEPFAGAVGFDVYLCDSAEATGPWVSGAGATGEALAGLAAAVSAHPLASLVLVQLLRVAPSLDLAGGLVAESLAYAALQAGGDHRSWLAERSVRPPRSGAEDERAPVAASRVGGTLHVVLDRPAVRNAYSAAMRDALVEVLRIAVADPGVTEVVIDGAGPDFCSGGDLDEFGLADDPAVAHAVRSTRHAGTYIAACADRCTVRVHGACVGAGTELAAFAGRVVAAVDTVFRLPELSMGLVPGAGGTVSLPRRIGSPRTAWLALTGHALGAEGARRWGLVDAVDQATDPVGPAVTVSDRG